MSKGFPCRQSTCIFHDGKLAPRVAIHSLTDRAIVKIGLSSMASGINAAAPGQRVPAWKRLGLKLKQAPPAQESTLGGPVVGHESSAQQHAQPGKRKAPGAHTAVESPAAVKRARRDEQASVPDPSLKKRKSVTFGDTPTKNDYKPAASDAKPAKQTRPQSKNSKGPPKKKQSPADTGLDPALEYLRHWQSSRETWKFNKNHQSSLIKHIFDSDIFPATDVDTFYQYIRDLKGFVRTRLQEVAMEIRTRDEAQGVSGFPQGTADARMMQDQYEAVLIEILRAQKLGSKRKAFNETDFQAASTHGDVFIRRVVKRMRAEVVLDELSDGGETDTSTTTTSSKTIAASNNEAAAMTNGEKRAKLNDGSGKRRRKLRVNVEDSSSSESESDGDSDSSSSDEEDSDDENDVDPSPSVDDTSSSSSSSESESDSDDEMDSDVEDEDEEL